MKDRTLVLRRTFANVSAEAVYDAWTRPELIAEWYGPEGFTNEIHEMDVRPDGNYRLTMHAPDGSKYPLTGVFRTLRRPERLSFTWKWETPPANGDPNETLVTVDIRQVGDMTEMVLTHEGFATADDVTNHETGWAGALDKLGRSLAEPSD